MGGKDSHYGRVARAKKAHEKLKAHFANRQYTDLLDFCRQHPEGLDYLSLDQLVEYHVAIVGSLGINYGREFREVTLVRMRKVVRALHGAETLSYMLRKHNFQRVVGGSKYNSILRILDESRHSERPESAGTAPSETPFQ